MKTCIWSWCSSGLSALTLIILLFTIDFVAYIPDEILYLYYCTWSSIYEYAIKGRFKINIRIGKFIKSKLYSLPFFSKRTATITIYEHSVVIAHNRLWVTLLCDGLWMMQISDSVAKAILLVSSKSWKAPEKKPWSPSANYRSPAIYACSTRRLNCLYNYQTILYILWIRHFQIL